LVALGALLVLGRRRGAAASALAAVLLLGASSASAQSDAEVGAEVDADMGIDADTDENVDEATEMTPEQAEAEIEEETASSAVEVVGPGEEPGEFTVVERRQVEANDGGFAVNDGLGVQISIFGSLDEGGIGGVLGLRYPLGEHFILGLDGEYDAWISAEAGRLEVGALNTYLTGIVVWKTLGRVQIRTNIHAGITVQLSELYNSDRFSVGPMFGITPVAFAVAVTRAVSVTVDPGGIFVEVPRVSPGPPLLRRAHRLMVGVQITP